MCFKEMSIKLFLTVLCLLFSNSLVMCFSCFFFFFKLQIVLNLKFYFQSASTGEKLAALRAEMTQMNIHAYIIPPEDEHQSEYTAE